MKAPRQFRDQVGFGDRFQALGYGWRGGSEAASEPCEGALFPRRRAWLTEKSIRRQVGGAQGTQQSHSPARVRGAGARGRREGGRRGGRGFLPHSPKQRRPTGRLRLRLAAGHRNPIMLLMSLSATGEVCARLGCLQATPRGSSCPAPGLGGKIAEGGCARERRERKRERALSCAPRGRGQAAPRAPPTALCAPRRAPAGQPSPRNFSTWPVRRPLWPEPRWWRSTRPSFRSHLTGGHRNRGGGSPTWPYGEWCGPAWEEKRAATSGSPQGRGNSAAAVAALKASREGTASQRRGSAGPYRGGSVRSPPRGADADDARGLPRPGSAEPALLLSDSLREAHADALGAGLRQRGGERRDKEGNEGGEEGSSNGRGQGNLALPARAPPSTYTSLLGSGPGKT